ncbi:dephospho-CoA kinase [Mycobacteroides abscessus subsp. abscessus]|nr:dephospho-CoA kinase [Mycobacteroides abscessus subsp. abscessus]
MRKTNIVPWSEEWASEFEKEAGLLKQIFQDNVIDIHHIGSTSIKTIGYAKPIIDILIAVHDISRVDRLNTSMLELGYEAKGENGIPGRRFFQKGGDHRTHHVHVFQEGDNQINFHLDFKRYLLQHPKQAARYKQKKLELANQYPDAHHRYQEGKQVLVSELAQLATQWAEEIRTLRDQ